MLRPSWPRSRSEEERLSICPTCGGAVDREAKACPYCGREEEFAEVRHSILNRMMWSVSATGRTHPARKANPAAVAADGVLLRFALPGRNRALWRGSDPVRPCGLALACSSQLSAVRVCVANCCSSLPEPWPRSIARPSLNVGWIHALCTLLLRVSHSAVPRFRPHRRKPLADVGRLIDVSVNPLPCTPSRRRLKYLRSDKLGESRSIVGG